MVVSGALRVSFGGSVAVTGSLIELSDADTELNELILTIEQQPRHGNITRDGQPLNEGDQFTVQQMNTRHIRSVTHTHTVSCSCLIVSLLFGRPYYRSSLWYSMSSVCLSVCL